MSDDAGRPLTALRVDGGAAANDLLMQVQADLLGAEIIRPSMVESTALGAARLAAAGAGLPMAAAAAAPAKIFRPRTTAEARAEALGRWREAVAKA